MLKPRQRVTNSARAGGELFDLGFVEAIKTLVNGSDGEIPADVPGPWRRVLRACLGWGAFSWAVGVAAEADVERRPSTQRDTPRVQRAYGDTGTGTNATR